LLHAASGDFVALLESAAHSKSLGAAVFRGLLKPMQPLHSSMSSSYKISGRLLTRFAQLFFKLNMPFKFINFTVN